MSMSSPVGLADPEAEHLLLRDAQEFLRRRLEQLAPDAVLTFAWEHFFSVYDRLIRSLAGACRVRRDDLDDVTQDVWLEVIVRLHRFQWSGNCSGLRSWFYRLVRSKVIDRLRHRVRHAVSSLAELPAEPASWDASPEELLERCWEQELLKAVLAEMQDQVADDDYRVFYLHSVEGRAMPEVAAQFGLTLHLAWWRHHQVMRKLRTRIAHYTGEPWHTSQD